MCDKYIWKFNSSDWIQDDIKKRFFLMNRETGDISNNQSGLDIIAGAKWHSTNSSDCGGFFLPLELKHCPFCGEALHAVEDHHEVWIPPFGNGNGLRLVSETIPLQSLPIKSEKTKKWLEQEKDSFQLPRPRGRYEFIIAPFGTTFSALIAFDRETGLLDYFSPAEKKWFSLTPPIGRRIGGSQLPNWSWSAAIVIGNAGFAVPTDDGPVWIALDWNDGTLMPISGTGDCIGGAAQLQNRVFIPVLKNGYIAIQHFDFSSLEWQQVGVPIKSNVVTDGDNHNYSVPIIDEGRRIIFWVGIQGLLAFDVTNSSSSWRPWETDAYPCRAVPELGPPYLDPSGNFWQICYDDYDNSQEERAFRYYKLTGDESDREDVDGGRFSSGISCCAKTYDLWDTPWAKKGQDLAHSVRAPLLCLDEKSKATITAHFGPGIILPVLDIIEDTKNNYHTEIQIEFPNDLPIQLKMPSAFNISSPWELRLFIYQKCLFAYSAKESVCYKWRLK